MLRPSRSMVSASSLNMVPGRMSFRRITTLTYMEASPSSRLRRRSRRRLSRPPCSEPGRLPLRGFRSQCGSGSGWARPRRSPTGASPIFQRHRPQRPAAEPYLRALGFLRHILVHLRPGVLVPGVARADRLPGHLAHPSFPYAGRGLAIAAVVINVLTTIIVIWMTMHGISMDDMYQAMLNMLAPGTGGSGSGDSVSV